LLKTTWERYRFDEELTGLEDMELAQRLIKDGGKVAYIAEAGVCHNHCETWPQVCRRFEREAIALQKIMPQVHVQFIDTLRYSASSIWKDWRSALEENAETSLLAIARYRWNQYKGVWKGNRKHRKLSHAEKEKYFYPD
jgi:rhamnosyltransferase